MSSSESEDENLKLFAESVDTSVFNNKLYDNNKNENSSNEDQNEEVKEEQKSQRYLDLDEEKVLKSDLNISQHMQEFIYKKLSKIIEDKVEFVEKSKKKRLKDEVEVNNLKLLSDSEETVKFYSTPDFIENRKKVEIKRRKIDAEIDDDEKVQKSAIDVEHLKNEIKNCTEKSRHKPYEYKNIKGIGYLREEPNEYTKIRNKNSWSESKIKTTKYFNKSLEYLVKR